jgi:hypothetical protein
MRSLGHPIHVRTPEVSAFASMDAPTCPNNNSHKMEKNLHHLNLYDSSLLLVVM